MGAIFISYRREDSEGQSGRLFEDLCDRFGADAVFMDVVGIEPGQDFRAVIDTKVAACSVLLSIIGRHWLSARDAAGQRRIDDTADFVRLETASALQRGVTVIPVLVQGARMPTAADLPADLRDLAFRNAVELSHARWSSDLSLLLASLQRLGFTPKDDRAGVPLTLLGSSRGGRQLGSAHRPSWQMLAAVLAVVVVLAGAWWALKHQTHVQRAADAAAQAALQQTLAEARDSLAAVTAVLAQTMAQAQAREKEAEQKAQAEKDARIEREAAERELAAARALEQENERLRRQALEARDTQRAAAARQQAEAAKTATAQREQLLRLATLRESQARQASTVASASRTAAVAAVTLQTAAATDAARRLQQGFGTHGLRVNRVDYAPTANGKAQGSFRRTGDRAWTEINAAGQPMFRFVETQRDEWSVYLHDSQRDVRIQLDLYTRRVNYSDKDNPALRKLYDLVDAA